MNHFSGIGWVLEAMGKLEESMNYNLEVLDICRNIGDQEGIGHTLAPVLHKLRKSN